MNQAWLSLYIKNKKWNIECIKVLIIYTMTLKSWTALSFKVRKLGLLILIQLSRWDFFTKFIFQGKAASLSCLLGLSFLSCFYELASMLFCLEHIWFTFFFSKKIDATMFLNFTRLVKNLGRRTLWKWVWYQKLTY